MELTHPRIRKATVTELRRSFGQHIVNFINRNDDVFSALTREATPFGGNWLMTN